MDCQAEAARATREVGAVERLLRDMHEKQRALNDGAAAADDNLQHMLRQIVDVGAEMREQFEQKRTAAGAPPAEGEGRERLLSAVAQLRREHKALDDVD